ncbi:hypothetical protein D1872_309700 [compost metagenome]
MLIERPHRSAQLTALSNYILRSTAQNRTDGQHSRLQRINRTTDDALKLHDECCSGHYRIIRMLGHAAMTAFSMNINIKIIRRRHHSPCTASHCSLR